MPSLATLDKDGLEAFKEGAERELADFKAQSLSLNMSRGKPSPDQLDLSLGLLDVLDSQSDPGLYLAHTTSDLRNYGMLGGIPQARALMAALMDVDPDHVMVLGNSSLNIMYDTVARELRAWSCAAPKFICPVPGYDRHFGVTEHLGIEMVNVEIGPDGPDMDVVEQLVQNDPDVKGIWCVPKYGNPSGITYSDDTVRRFARLRPAAPDFRIYWDNAYAVHDFSDTPDQLLSLEAECLKADNPDIYFIFASTSKISFASGGIAAIASSPANLAKIESDLSFHNIGPDKLNQLRHVLFFKDLAGIKAHMAKQAELIRPKFASVLATLESELGGLEAAEWSHPNGGYFICFKGLSGTAARTIALCAESGVTLTGAGAPFPYHKDPEDRVIRIAPTYPGLVELKTASEILCTAYKIAAAERLLAL
ncbi:MAG: aminotransferase [Coriobacteriales bacterium]|jgi:DNA-binding transcriptional MocR family regulator|nr:aminotransferase [Coriobacteriales bacterium]